MKKLMSIGLILLLASTAFVASAQKPFDIPPFDNPGADVLQNDPLGQEDPMPEDLYLPVPALDGNPFDHFLLPGTFL